MILPSREKSSSWDPFSFFLLISFPFAIILTIIFISLNIKTIFWSDERGRHSGYISVSLLLWGFMAFISELLYVIYFLLKAIKEKPKQRKLASKLYFIFLGSQYYFPKSFSTGRWGHTMGWPISITMIIG